MEITVKNVTVYPRLSQETTAYNATIYVDGVKAFEAENDGHGGCDFFRPVKGYTGPTEQEIDAWLKANKPQIEAYGVMLDPSLEMEVADAIQKIDAQKRLARILKTKIAILRDGQVLTYSAQVKPTPANLDRVRAQIAAAPDCTDRLINGDAEAEALALAAL